jgi:hypothetical protein
MPSGRTARFVHSWHPVGFHGGLLLLGILAPVTFGLHDQMQKVVVTVPIVHQHDEIRKVPSRFGAVAVGRFQPEVVILDVCLHPWVGFGHAAEG